MKRRRVKKAKPDDYSSDFSSDDSSDDDRRPAPSGAASSASADPVAAAKPEVTAAKQEGAAAKQEVEDAVRAKNGSPGAPERARRFYDATMTNLEHALAGA